MTQLFQVGPPSTPVTTPFLPDSGGKGLALSANQTASVAQEQRFRIFDGARDPRSGAWHPILPQERDPKSRRHGLPEDELEPELPVAAK